MSDSLIQLPAMARGASFAGTCLMHTMMFTRMLPFGISQKQGREKNRGSARLRNLVLLPRPAPENERGVGAAKTKGIRKRILNRSFARMLRHVVQIAFGIGILEIDRGRQDLIVQGENADACFKSPRATQKM